MRQRILTKQSGFSVLAMIGFALLAGCEVNYNENTATLERDKPRAAANANASPAASPSPSASVNVSPSASPLASPSPTASIPPPADEPAPTDKQAIAVVPNDKLIIPVVGVKPEELRDTFKDSRSEGRVHDAIDIMAKQGTPVVAAADGEIARFFDSERGGITIYQYSKDKKFIYYYAHLDKRADNLREKEFVKQGTIIGYVGDTGNSGKGNYHLHFAIWIIEDPKRYWDGVNINPYPLLKQ
jgi:peptidoglycan LD-endopeptidase LytH